VDRRNETNTHTDAHLGKYAIVIVMCYFLLLRKSERIKDWAGTVCTSCKLLHSFVQGSEGQTQCCVGEAGHTPGNNMLESTTLLYVIAFSTYPRPFCVLIGT
jgi:hypothetical protein